MAAQLNLPRRGDGYPVRPAFFFHRFTRLLGKVCAAQHVGPDGAWLLTIIAATEDSARYKHAIAWTDDQIAPFVGVSPSKMRRLRARCVSAGWLHYESGWKGVPSLYWVTIPPAYEIRDGEYLDDELAKAIQIRAQFERESGAKAEGNPDRNRRESASESDAKANALHTYSVPPQTTSTTVPESADGGGVLETTSRQAGCGDLLAPTENEALSSFLPNAEQLAELQTRLRGIGIDLVDKTLGEAFDAGHSVESILQVIAYAEERPGWWGGGAVRIRLTRQDAVPLPVDRGWAKPDPKAKAKWHDELRRKAEAAKLDALSSSSPPSKGGAGGGPSETLKTQQEWDWDALERQYGEQIDAASIDELCEVQPTDFAKKLLRKLALRDPNFRRIECHRRDLLRAFHRKAST